MKIEKKFKKQVKKIIKTYYAILVKINEIPDLAEKNVISVYDIDSLVNAQMETRKPILYFEEEKSVSFILVDGTETLFYILKQEDCMENSLEKSIKSSKENKNSFIMDFLKKIENLIANVNDVKLLNAPAKIDVENIGAGNVAGIKTEAVAEGYYAMTVKELRKIAKAQGIKNLSRKNKDELIDELNKLKEIEEASKIEPEPEQVDVVTEANSISISDESEDFDELADVLAEIGAANNEIQTEEDDSVHIN